MEFKDLTTHIENIYPDIFKSIIKKIEDDDELKNDICLSYRHDYGLLSEEEKKSVKFQLEEWLRAIRNNY